MWIHRCANVVVEEEDACESSGGAAKRRVPERGSENIPAAAKKAGPARLTTSVADEAVTGRRRKGELDKSNVSWAADLARKNLVGGVVPDGSPSVVAEEQQGSVLGESMRAAASDSEAAEAVRRWNTWSGLGKEEEAAQVAATLHPVKRRLMKVKRADTSADLSGMNRRSSMMRFHWAAKQGGTILAADGDRVSVVKAPEPPGGGRLRASAAAEDQKTLERKLVDGDQYHSVPIAGDLLMSILEVSTVQRVAIGALLFMIALFSFMLSSGTSVVA